MTVYQDDPESNSDRDRDWERKRQEFHGARHKIEMSDMNQREDPAWLLAWGAPETLPVGQEIQRGPDLGRSEQFFVGTRRPSRAGSFLAVLGSFAGGARPARHAAANASA